MKKILEDKAEMIKIQRELAEMASKYESVNKQRRSPFGNDNMSQGIPGEVEIGGAVLVKVPKWKNQNEHSTDNLHKKDNVFDTSGLTADEREAVIRKKWNMHWDPKKSHWDNYIPPDESPDLAYEDNWPIKGMRDDAFKTMTDS